MVPLRDRTATGELAPGILESCRAGDREAFRVLYDLYKDRVYSIALYFFQGDETSAADVTQQVFLKLITAIPHFKGDSAFSTWLYRLVVNACQDAARRRKHNLAATVDDLTVPESQEEDLVRTQVSRSIQDAIASLPPKLRMAVLLRYFDELSYEQMAEALHCSMGTVASRLSRGHRMLAERLQSLRGRR